MCSQGHDGSHHEWRFSRGLFLFFFADTAIFPPSNYSTALDCSRKFRNFWGSSFALRRLSDRLCLENVLSIVENPKPRSKGKYKHYGEWQKERKRPLNFQERLCLAIDSALAKRPASLEEFLDLMKQAGYEGKKVRGGGLSFRLPGGRQDRFTREI